MRIELTVLAILLASPLARADAPAAAPKTLDISAVKAKLRVLSDGKQHYVVINPDEISDEFFFYGNGKAFWGQRTFGGGRDGESFSRNYWEPRVKARYQASFDYRDKKYVVQCEERKTELKPVSEDEKKSILDGAKFYAPLWSHRAYALARDNTGKYFYVDKLREPEDSKVFRVWSGMKGAMKIQKLTNIVSDSEGDIFATKTGSLRVVLDKGESLWTQGAKKQKLIMLPIEDNAVLIYSELGVYTGERLGTPCDDL